MAERLAALAREAGLLVAEVNGVPTADHAIAPFLAQAGFTPSAMGFMLRRSAAPPPPRDIAADEDVQPEEVDGGEPYRVPPRARARLAEAGRGRRRES